MKTFIVELVGTFFLMLTIGLVVAPGGAGALAPFAIGALLIAMIFAGGHISGAHYNPAVTLAFWLRGRCPTSQIAPYIGAQLAGGALAALVTLTLSGQAAFPVREHALMPLALAELLFTFALVWVILHTATAASLEGNPFYGLAIGSMVTAGAFAVGPISSAVFNPAVAIGLCMVGLLPWSLLWVYLAAQLVGAILAALAFRTVIFETVSRVD